jgi:putative ABC transport system permease protein
VSKETITDYGLSRGDLVRLRVLDRRSGTFAVVPFHVVGVVLEFPSAPRDSFMVANERYLERVTHAPGGNVLLVRTSGDPTAVGRRVAHLVAPAGGSVRTIREQTQQTTSSITTVDLTGIAGIEEAFAVVLAAAAIILYLQLALAERRRELATMAALGTRIRDMAAFLWSEAALILGAGLLLAAGLGLLLAAMLTAMLTHVFDPPPDHLAIPWRYLLALAGAAVAACAAATAVATASLRRLPLAAILRE